MEQLIAVLFSWLVALLTWSSLGSGALNFIRFELDHRPVHHFVLATCVGAAIASTILGFLSIWFPINFGTSLVVLLISVVAFRKSFKRAVLELWPNLKKWKWHGHVFLAVLIGMAITITLQPSLHNDSGLYYIQFMKWINNYPAIPGLANLHDRLGFNSHWHLLSAAYNAQLVWPSGTNDLNALLFVLIGFGSVASAMRLSEKPSLYDAIWAAFPLPFFLLMRFLTSTSPDLPSAMLPVVFLTLLLQKRNEGLLPVLILVLAFAVTIKVTSALFIIALIPPMFWTIQNREWKTVGMAATLGLAIASPWIIRNVIQTGYLIFPMESIDLFSFDWKVPQELTANARKMVSTHAKMGTYDLTRFDNPMAEWLPFWFSVQSKSVLGIFVLVASAAFLLLSESLLKMDRKLSTSRKTTVQLFLSITVLISLVFWWISGPNPRFVYGIIFFFLAYTLGSLMIRLGLGKWLQFVPILALVPLLLITRIVLNEPPPTKPSEFTSMQHANGIIYHPTNTDKCWTCDLPCTNMARNDLQFRGNRLEEGFINTSIH